MIDAVKKLRDKTNAGIMDCKNALKESNGDVEKAIEILRKQGKARASKKSGRAAKDGSIESYIHMGGKIGVLLEINCETDFVARNSEFKKLAKDTAMQIAAARPTYVNREEVPQNIIEKEREIFAEQLSQENGKKKPQEVVDKIIDNKLETFFEETCLLEQPFIKDPKIKIKDLIEVI